MTFTKDESEYEEEPIDTNAQGQPSTFVSSEQHCCVLYRARFFSKQHVRPTTSKSLLQELCRVKCTVPQRRS